MSRRQHELNILVDVYTKCYEEVYCRRYFEGRKLLTLGHSEALVGELDDALVKEFEGLLDWLHLNNARVDIHNVAWQGYLKYAMRTIAERDGISRPRAVKNLRLWRAYWQTSAAVKYDPNGRKVNYIRILDPEIRSPEYIALLGLGNAPT